MKIINHLPIISLLAIICLVSCHRNDEVAHIDIVDFGHIAARAATDPNNDNLADASWVASSHPSRFETMMTIMGTDVAHDDSVDTWLNSPVVKGFADAVCQYAPTSDDILRAVSFSVSAANKEGLELPARKFATAIWGRPQSILFADSTMFIGLNHYLGADHPAYNSLPAYRRRAKDPSAMDYDIAEAIVATSYPYPDDAAGSIANRMMYEGALIMAKMRLVEDPDEAEALGYNSQELEWLKSNESSLWKKMLASKIIFDKSEVLADKLFAPSPATTVLAPDAPGRAGRFIGYQLIKSLLKSHPDISLTEYLSEKMYMADNPLIGINYN